MKKIKVGQTINRYTDILTMEECDILYNYTKERTNNPVDDASKVPWQLEKSNTLFYPTIQDQDIRKILQKYKNAIAADATEELGEKIYPHLTTLVYWKPGQRMPRHVDDGNGYPEREDQLGMRFMASITYLNDDYNGGHTFVRNDGINDKGWRSDSTLGFPNDVFEDYISIPEKGATITFLSDDSNAHGVTELEKGDRAILSTWFTKDEKYQERDDLIIDQTETQKQVSDLNQQGLQTQTQSTTTQQTTQNWNR